MAFDKHSTASGAPSPSAPDPEACELALRAIWGAMKPKARQRALGVLRLISKGPETTADRVVNIHVGRAIRGAAHNPAGRAREWRLAAGVRMIADSLSEGRS